MKTPYLFMGLLEDAWATTTFEVRITNNIQLKEFWDLGFMRAARSHASREDRTLPDRSRGKWKWIKACCRVVHTGHRAIDVAPQSRWAKISAAHSDS